MIPKISTFTNAELANDYKSFFGYVDPLCLDYQKDCLFFEIIREVEDVEREPYIQFSSESDYRPIENLEFERTYIRSPWLNITKKLWKPENSPSTAFISCLHHFDASLHNFQSGEESTVTDSNAHSVKEWLSKTYISPIGDTNTQASHFTGGILAFANILRSVIIVNYSDAQDSKVHLRNKVESYSLLEPGWGDETSVPPNAETISQARLFIDLLPTGVPLPQISIAEDGEIIFYWRSNSANINAGLFGDGEIHYYASVVESGIDIDNSEPFHHKSLPKKLLEAIVSV